MGSGAGKRGCRVDCLEQDVMECMWLALQEECQRLRQSIKCGFIKALTVVSGVAKALRVDGACAGDVCNVATMVGDGVEF